MHLFCGFAVQQTRRQCFQSMHCKLGSCVYWRQCLDFASEVFYGYDSHELQSCRGTQKHARKNTENLQRHVMSHYVAPCTVIILDLFAYRIHDSQSNLDWLNFNIGSVVFNPAPLMTIVTISTSDLAIGAWNGIAEAPPNQPWIELRRWEPWALGVKGPVRTDNNGWGGQESHCNHGYVAHPSVCCGS